ncbi:MAG: Septum site-determining protein MinD [Firmicutes bacterium ADurb.Bin262]|nr:MAG: Septum site-determining protein MinD [Firmicutes bacterium ADurb.Bin262]
MLNIDEVIDMTGIRLIGVVPEDPVVAFNTVKGMPVPANSPAARAFADIAERLEGGNVPLKL